MEFHLLFITGGKMALSFYDIDKNYVKYLQEEEIKARGFTRVPNVEYPGRLPKFVCGVVLEIRGYKYYVPVTSYKRNQLDNILIEISSERYNRIKGSLRFNFMFPVPDNCIKERIIANDPNKTLLNLEWNFCNSNEERIRNKAKQTYSKVINRVNANTINNSCDFLLLESLCTLYNKRMKYQNKKTIHKLKLIDNLHTPICFKNGISFKRYKKNNFRKR